MNILHFLEYLQCLSFLHDGPLRKHVKSIGTLYKTMVGLSEWKQTLQDLEKAPDVAHEDLLNEIDSIGGGVKTLLGTE